ncbi:MAG: glycosyltransferase [Chloroflexota bacterium]|nr:glycosyltransferase [Chloroflexota bacterium]
MRPVTVGTKGVDAYARLVGEEKIDEIRRLAEPLRGARVLHVNATAYGGGVAEILSNLVPLMNDVGLEALWYVLDARDPTFFDVTKRIHNALQGMPLDLSDQMRELFLETDRANAAQLPDVDFVIAHDPQAIALRHFASASEASWAWRCHIDLTDAYTPVWSFLRPYVEAHDAAIFTMPQFAQPDLTLDRIVFSAPSIDPFTEKNGPLAADDARAIVAAFRLDPARPLLVQVSRFDPWKDPNGVIDAYRRVKAEIPEVQLALIGSLADDDPEGKDFLARSIAHAAGDPDVRCLTDLDGVRDREVNAFQRSATVVIQKSLREGFGLVVAEALWKGIPVVGGAVGGIPLQIVDGETGYLVRTVEECAERCLRLLRDADLRSRMGAAGHERVRGEFLITRDLRDHLRLFSDLRAAKGAVGGTRARVG